MSIWSTITDWGMDAVDWFADDAIGWIDDISFGDAVDFGSEAVSFLGETTKGLENIAGSLSPVVSSYFQGETLKSEARRAEARHLAQADGYTFQAGMANLNGRIAMKNLDNEIQMTFADEQRMIRQQDKVKGAAQASYAASGVQLSGSALDVMRDNATEAALDVAMLRYESEIRQENILLKKQGFDLTEQQYNKAASVAKQNAVEEIKAGEAAKDMQDIMTISKGIGSVDNVLGAVSDIADLFGDEEEKKK